MTRRASVAWMLRHRRAALADLLRVGSALRRATRDLALRRRWMAAREAHLRAAANTGRHTPRRECKGARRTARPAARRQPITARNRANLANLGRATTRWGSSRWAECSPTAAAHR